MTSVVISLSAWCSDSGAITALFAFEVLSLSVVSRCNGLASRRWFRDSQSCWPILCHEPRGEQFTDRQLVGQIALNEMLFKISVADAGLLFRRYHVTK